MSINVCNNNSMSEITSLPSGVGGGSLVLISTQTASSSSTIDFTSGIDSTYKEYIFKFFNIHPSNDQVRFNVNFRDGSTAYDATKTTTWFQAEHLEDGSSSALEYQSGNDLAQSTGVQIISGNVGNANDENISGILHLFDPSSTTFVKHFIATLNVYDQGDYSINPRIAGYFNTTSALTGLDFKMSSGNIDSGVIKMYGITK